MCAPTQAKKWREAARAHAQLRNRDNTNLITVLAGVSEGVMNLVEGCDRPLHEAGAY
jgi:hypothetical protein